MSLSRYGAWADGNDEGRVQRLLLPFASLSASPLPSAGPVDQNILDGPYSPGRSRCLVLVHRVATAVQERRPRRAAPSLLLEEGVRRRRVVDVLPPDPLLCHALRRGPFPLPGLGQGLLAPSLEGQPRGSGGLAPLHLDHPVFALSPVPIKKPINLGQIYLQFRKSQSRPLVLVWILSQI